MKITQIIPTQQYGNLTLECESIEEYKKTLKELRGCLNNEETREDIVNTLLIETKLNRIIKDKAKASYKEIRNVEIQEQIKEESKKTNKIT